MLTKRRVTRLWLLRATAPSWVLKVNMGCRADCMNETGSIRRAVFHDQILEFHMSNVPKVPESITQEDEACYPLLPVNSP